MSYLKDKLFWFSAEKRAHDVELKRVWNSKDTSYYPTYFNRTGEEFSDITDVGEVSSYSDAILIGAGTYEDITYCKGSK